MSRVDLPPPTQGSIPATEVGFNLASPASRLGAYLLDALVVFAGFGVATAAAGAEPALGFLVALGLFGAFFVFWNQGTTPGKKILGIYVYTPNGNGNLSPANLGQMVVREVVGKSISAAVFYLGFLWILVDDNHQGWHDKFIDSYVIYEQ